jgi:tight adherence protein C
MDASWLVHGLLVVGAVGLVRPGPAARPPTTIRPGAGVAASPLVRWARRASSSTRWVGARQGPVSVVAWARRRPAAVGALALGAVLVGPVPVVAVVSALATLRWWSGRRRVHREAQRLADEVPDAVDLLRLAVASGCTVRLAVDALADHGAGPVAAHADAVVARLGRGDLLGPALEDLGAREPVLAPVTTALVAADRYGTPLGPVLARLADDARAARRRRAEAAARRVPVQLLFPLVACILPAVGLLTVVPVAVSAMRGLAS